MIILEQLFSPFSLKSKSKSVNQTTRVIFGILLLTAVLFASYLFQTIHDQANAAPSKNPPQSQFVSNQILIKVKGSIKGQIKTDNPINTGVSSFDAINKSLKVKKLEKILLPTSKNSNSELAAWYVVELPSNKKIVKGSYNSKNKVISGVSGVSDLQNLLSEYSSDPHVVTVEPNFVAHTTLVPNDPYYSSFSSWGQSYADMWGMKDINLESIWDLSTGFPSVLVADIDTGVDRNHPDLSGNMWQNQGEMGSTTQEGPTPNCTSRGLPLDKSCNNLDDDGNGFVDDYQGWNFVANSNDPMDDFGHGTHTAGTLAAQGNNGVGVVGVTWKSNVLVVKFLDNSGSGTLEAGAQALQYAADMGAKVSSNSWGCNCQSQLIDDAVKYEHDHGMVVVVAAGNSSSDALDFSPASSDDAITVSALNTDNTLASFSNFGSKIDVAAPGVDILSTRASKDVICGSTIVGTNYCRLSGTSMATPHVAGLAALILGINPNLTNEQVRQILRHGATDLGPVGPDIDFGYGRIDGSGSAALINAPLLAPIIASPSSRTTVVGTVQVSGSADGTSFASYKVEMGQGRQPSNWTTVATSTSPVSNGTLASVDTTQFPDGNYTIRLTETDTSGVSSVFQIFDITVQNNTPSPTPTSTPIVTPTPTIPLTPTPTPPPSVSISFPANGSILSGTQPVYFQWTDSATPTKVELYVDNALYGSSTAYPNFAVNWDTTQFVEGTHTLQGKLYDNAGNTALTTTNTVTVDNTWPTGSITSPANGANVQGIVPVTVQASDNYGVSSVDVYIDYTLVKTVTQQPYTYNWDTASLAIGSKHTLYAAIHDFASHETSTPLQTVTINDPVPPTVSITQPTNNSFVTKGSTVTVAASASDNVGVTKVELYSNGFLFCTDTQSPYSCSLTVAKKAGTVYTLTAKAYDAAGNGTTSSPVNITTK